PQSARTPAPIGCRSCRLSLAAGQFQQRLDPEQIGEEGLQVALYCHQPRANEAHQVLTMRRRDSLPEVAPSAFLSADREGPAPAEEGSALHPLYPALPDPDELLAGTDLH